MGNHRAVIDVLDRQITIERKNAVLFALIRGRALDAERNLLFRVAFDNLHRTVFHRQITVTDEEQLVVTGISAGAGDGMLAEVKRQRISVRELDLLGDLRILEQGDGRLVSRMLERIRQREIHVVTDLRNRQAPIVAVLRCCGFNVLVDGSDEVDLTGSIRFIGVVLRGITMGACQLSAGDRHSGRELSAIGILDVDRVAGGCTAAADRSRSFLVAGCGDDSAVTDGDRAALDNKAGTTGNLSIRNRRRRRSGREIHGRFCGIGNAASADRNGLRRSVVAAVRDS